MQTVQLILDKQGSILSAVTPILPFLQGLPPLVEALKTVLTDKLRELSSTLKDGPRSNTSPVTTTKRKRIFTGHGAETSVSPSSNVVKSPGSSHKRSRVMDLSAQRESIPSVFVSSDVPLRQTPASIEAFPFKQTLATQKLTTPRRHLNNFAVPLFPPSSTSRRRPIPADSTNSAPLLSVPTSLSVRSCTNVPLLGQSGTPTAFRSRSNSIVTVADVKEPHLIDDKTAHPKPAKNELNFLQSSAQDSERLRTCKSTTTPVQVVGRITRSNTRVHGPLVLPPPPRSDIKQGMLTTVKEKHVTRPGKSEDRSSSLV